MTELPTALMAESEILLYLELNLLNALNHCIVSFKVTFVLVRLEIVAKFQIPIVYLFLFGPLMVSFLARGNA